MWTFHSGSAGVKLCQLRGNARKWVGESFVPHSGLHIKFKNDCKNIKFIRYIGTFIFHAPINLKSCIGNMKRKRGKLVALHYHIYPKGYLLENIWHDIYERKKITFLLNHDCKNNDKNWHKERVQPKKWCPPRKFFYLLFSVIQSFLLEFPWSPDNITANNNKNKYKSLSVYLR